MTIFAKIEKIPYEGPQSSNPLAFKYYNKDEVILGKTLEEHLRFSVCYWHNFVWQGHDIFGQPTMNRPADPNDIKNDFHKRLDFAFDFMSKLGTPFFCFHDHDLVQEGPSIRESRELLSMAVDGVKQKMEETGLRLLWGTANLFSHPRYAAGAATNPDPEVFAYAISKVQGALAATHELGGAGYVLWNGRDGYETLLNTDLKQEFAQMERFLSLVVDYKHKIGFKGSLFIEPKPQEPTKHQYDFDTATVFATLQKFGLQNEIQVNIEANHATLSGHSFHHEVAMACALGIFGSIDANRGDPQCGWDTDQFPNSVEELTPVCLEMIKHGGFTQGGFNFDTKLRRQSIAPEDMFHAHIGAMDCIARAFKIAAQIHQEGSFYDLTKARYNRWQSDFGKKILAGDYDMEQLSSIALEQKFDPKPQSGHQEFLENTINGYINRHS